MPKSKVPASCRISNRRLSEESSRRRPAACCVGSAAPAPRLAASWAALSRTHHTLAQQKPRHTDKLPSNWLLSWHARRDAPGRRIIDARRDALEAGWSCYKQQFYRLPHFACTLTDIAAYVRDYERDDGPVARRRTAAHPYPALRSLAGRTGAGNPRAAGLLRLAVRRALASITTGPRAACALPARRRCASRCNAIRRARPLRRTASIHCVSALACLRPWSSPKASDVDSLFPGRQLKVVPGSTTIQGSIPSEAPPCIPCQASTFPTVRR